MKEFNAFAVTELSIDDAIVRLVASLISAFFLFFSNAVTNPTGLVKLYFFPEKAMEEVTPYR